MSKQSLKSSRMRNIFVMITIVLASALLMAILMYAVGQREDTKRQLSHAQEVGYYHLTNGQVEALKADERIAYQVQVKTGTPSEMNGFDAIPYYVSELSDKIQIGELESGALPEAENEIAVQGAMLEKMGIAPNIGSQVTLNFYDGNTETFTVTGILKGGENAKQFAVFFSKDYADKYMKISKDMELNNVIYSKSMDILRSNNSSDTEGLCVISVSNRQVLLNVRGKPDAIGVELNKKQMSIINKHKNDIIGIHNHPTNLLPNGSDFVAAGARGYQYGIVVTHDGRIYKYSVGDKPFLPYLLDNRIDKYCSKEYNLNIKEAYEKALNEFRKEYGISWQEIE